MAYMCCGIQYAYTLEQPIYIYIYTYTHYMYM